MSATALSEIEDLIREHQTMLLPTEQLLTTESPHPLTFNLSSLAQHDLIQAYETLVAVDLQVLSKVADLQNEIERLANTFCAVLAEGGRIIMGGCGSAARAAMIAEILFRQAFPDYQEQVMGLGAGGDLVIVRAAEGFEDKADYGWAQLEALALNAQDLYVGVSASGAASFVSGQLEFALTTQPKHRPIFFICNPVSECMARFATDEKTIFHPSKQASLEQLDILSCCVGEMALAGSTRMQAATVQLLVLAFALLQAGTKMMQREALLWPDFIQTLKVFLRTLPLEGLAALTQFETDINLGHDYAVYATTPELALSVATDTTERSPTFNWAYFENDSDTVKTLASVARARIVIEGYHDNLKAMTAMVGRNLRVLNWVGNHHWSLKKQEPTTTLDYLLGYDLTAAIISKRQVCLPQSQARMIQIHLIDTNLRIQFESVEILIPLHLERLAQVLHNMYLQLALKMVINMHSTLLAGALGAYTQNMMTSVRPSNLKLLNRAIALTERMILSAQFTNFQDLGLPVVLQKNIQAQEIRDAVYRAMRIVKPGESVVFKARDILIQACREKYEKSLKV